MKKKFARNKRNRKRELLILAHRDEVLDTRRAMWLVSSQSDTLLRFEYDLTRHGTTVNLHYDVQSLVSLKSFLKRYVLDDSGLAHLIRSVADVLDVCSHNHIPTEMVLFDPSYVFVDDRYQPRFAIVPLSNVPYDVANSPLTMLHALGNTRKISFASPMAEMLCAQLEAFVLNQNNVFSANDFREFLREYCGVSNTIRETSGNNYAALGNLMVETDETKLRVWNLADGYDKSRVYLQRLSNGDSFLLGEVQQVGVGRGTQNSIRILGNPKISRNHALLRYADGKIRLVDLDSSNGTWVQGKRLEPNVCAYIQVGERFSLANEEFVVVRVT